MKNDALLDADFNGPSPFPAKVPTSTQLLAVLLLIQVQLEALILLAPFGVRLMVGAFSHKLFLLSLAIGLFQMLALIWSKDRRLHLYLVLFVVSLVLAYFKTLYEVGLRSFMTPTAAAIWAEALQQAFVYVAAGTVVGTIWRYYGRHPQAKSWYRLWEGWSWWMVLLVAGRWMWWSTRQAPLEDATLVLLEYWALALTGLLVLYGYHRAKHPQTPGAPMVLSLSAGWLCSVSIAALSLEREERIVALGIVLSLLFLILLLLLWYSQRTAHQTRLEP